jgi:hypothetical protein
MKDSFVEGNRTTEPRITLVGYGATFDSMSLSRMFSVFLRSLRCADRCWEETHATKHHNADFRNQALNVLRYMKNGFEYGIRGFNGHEIVVCKFSVGRGIRLSNKRIASAPSLALFLSTLTLANSRSSA